MYNNQYLPLTTQDIEGAQAKSRLGKPKQIREYSEAELEKNPFLRSKQSAIQVYLKYHPDTYQDLFSAFDHEKESNLKNQFTKKNREFATITDYKDHYNKEKEIKARLDEKYGAKRSNDTQSPQTDQRLPNTQQLTQTNQNPYNLTQQYETADFARHADALDDFQNEFQNSSQTMQNSAYGRPRESPNQQLNPLESYKPSAEATNFDQDQNANDQQKMNWSRTGENIITSNQTYGSGKNNQPERQTPKQQPVQTQNQTEFQQQARQTNQQQPAGSQSKKDNFDIFNRDYQQQGQPTMQKPTQNFNSPQSQQPVNDPQFHQTNQQTKNGGYSSYNPQQDLRKNQQDIINGQSLVESAIYPSNIGYQRQAQGSNNVQQDYNRYQQQYSDQQSRQVAQQTAQTEKTQQQQKMYQRGYGGDMENKKDVNMIFYQHTPLAASVSLKTALPASRLIGTNMPCLY